MVDMDGTLADFDGGMKAWLTKIGSPDEVAKGDHYFLEQTDEPPHIRERRRLIKLVPGFWKNLETLRVGMEIFSYLVKLRFQISILTKAPKHNPNAWSEKVEWCNNRLPTQIVDGNEIGMNIVTTKSLVYGKVLVDDWPAYIAPWLKRRPRGLVIMPAQPWNVGFGHNNIIRVTNDADNSLSRAWEALAAIRKTCLP